MFPLTPDQLKDQRSTAEPRNQPKAMKGQKLHLGHTVLPSCKISRQSATLSPRYLSGTQRNKETITADLISDIMHTSFAFAIVNNSYINS